MDSITLAICMFAIIFSFSMSIQWWTLSRIADNVDNLAHQISKIADILKEIKEQRKE